MRFSIASLAIGLLPLVSTAPAPLQKRALSASDTSVLQLALFLEHLELNLYTGGYLNFTDAQYIAAGFPAGFRANVGVIASVRTVYLAASYSFLTMPRPTARIYPSIDHHVHPGSKRHHPSPKLHLQLPLQLPTILRRPRQHDNLVRLSPTSSPSSQTSTNIPLPPASASEPTSAAPFP